MAEKAMVCPACNGTRMIPNPAMGGRMQVCPLCEGRGNVLEQPIRVPYDYPVGGVVGALGVLTPTLQIQQDADFEWVWTVATRTAAGLTVQVEDAATGRRLMSAPINIDNFAGTAQLPFPLVEPYIVARTSNLNWTFTDTSGAPNTVQLVLRGYKLFPQQAPEQGSSGLVRR